MIYWKSHMNRDIVVILSEVIISWIGVYRKSHVNSDIVMFFSEKWKFRWKGVYWKSHMNSDIVFFSLLKSENLAENFEITILLNTVMITYEWEKWIWRIIINDYQVRKFSLLFLVMLRRLRQQLIVWIWDEFVLISC